MDFVGLTENLSVAQVNPGFLPLVRTGRSRDVASARLRSWLRTWLSRGRSPCIRRDLRVGHGYGEQGDMALWPGQAGARRAAPIPRQLLGDGDFFAEVDILDGVQEFYAFGHGTLEGLAPGDETGAASALVDHGG